MILESFREYGVPQRVRYECPDAVNPRDASYYDLVRTPSGHTPAPKLRFWKWLSVPVKELRDNNTFTCPRCGEGSFFKTWTYCDNCNEYLDWNEYPNTYDSKREKRRRLLKDIECAILPILLLFGKAWYMPSIRGKWPGEELHATRIRELVPSPPPPPPQPVTGPLDAYLEGISKRVSFRVRRRYFDQIVAGTKREEIRTDKPYWAWLFKNPPQVAVFVCGKSVHRRHITRIYREDPEKVLGRPLSEQGIKDVLSNPAIIVELGGEVNDSQL